MTLRLGSLGAIGVAGILGVAIAMSPDWALRVVTLLIVVTSALLLQRRLSLGPLSPAAILIVAYLALAALGPLAADAVAVGHGVSARIVLAPDAELGAFFVLVIAAAATALGSWLYSVLRPPRPADRTRAGRVRISGRMLTAAVVCGVIPLALQIVAFGPGLIYRSEYLGGRDSADPLVIAALTLPLPAIAILGWLTQVFVVRAGKLLSVSLLIGYAFTLFSLGTRAFALIPLMFTLGMVAARPESKKLVAGLVAAAVASVLLLQIPLALRASEYHGLVPYLAVVSHGITLDLASIASNVLVAFQLTGQVAFSTPPLGLDTLFISLDPRPGASSGWYDIQQQLRINVFTPYNALGELGNHGWVVLTAFFVAVGGYFGHLENRLKSLLAEGQGLAALILFALACLFIVLTLEYNLRSCARILYYLAAADLSIAVIQWQWRQVGQRIARRSLAAQSPDGTTWLAARDRSKAQL